MGRTDDPNKVGWRFWMKHLRNVFVATLFVFVVGHFVDEPFSLARFAVWYVLGVILWLGPALSLHYYGPKR